MPQPKKKVLSARPSSAAPGAAPSSRPVLTYEGPAELTWDYNPWIHSTDRGWRRPQMAFAALLLCCMIAAIGLAEHRTIPELAAWTLAGLAISMGMCAPLFLPVQYRLDQRGVTVTFLLVPSFRPWEHYRNFYVHDTGVHLTTMPRPSPLDAFRGHYLQWGTGLGRRELVEPFIAGHVRREADSAA